MSESRQSQSHSLTSGFSNNDASKAFIGGKSPNRPLLPRPRQNINTPIQRPAEPASYSIGEVQGEEMTPGKACQALSEYFVFRFEPSGHHSDGKHHDPKPDWNVAIVTEVRGISKLEAHQQVKALGRGTCKVEEKLSTLNAAQRRQLEKVLEDLQSRDLDHTLFQTNLVQLDHTLKKNLEPISTKRVVPKKSRNRRLTRANRRGKRRDNNSESDSVVIITAYYKRSPRPGLDPVTMYQQREAHLKSVHDHQPVPTGAAAIGDLKPESDRNSDNESEESDIESIMSEISLASSQSSVHPDVSQGAEDEIRDVFLSHEALNQLLPIAVRKVGPERFQRNFRRLLVQYSRDLSAEAQTPLQRTAARALRSLAYQVSVQISNQITDTIVNDNIAVSTPRSKQERTRAKILEYLQHMQVEDVESEHGDEDSDEAGGDDDEPLETGLQALESARGFLTSSKAFSSFCRAFKNWINPETEAETRLVDEALSKMQVKEPLGNSHSDVDNQNETQRREEKARGRPTPAEARGDHQELERSRSRSLNPPETEPSMMQNVAGSDSEGTDSDEAEHQNIILKRRVEREKRHKRMASDSIGKQSITVSYGSDTDMEDPKAFLDIGSSARRLRRRVNDLSLQFHDPPPLRIEECDEPESSSDGDILIRETLVRELPYYEVEYLSMEIDSPASSDDEDGSSMHPLQFQDRNSLSSSRSPASSRRSSPSPIDLTNRVAYPDQLHPSIPLSKTGIAAPSSPPQSPTDSSPNSPPNSPLGLRPTEPTGQRLLLTPSQRLRASRSPELKPSRALMDGNDMELDDMGQGNVAFPTSEYKSRSKDNPDAAYADLGVMLSGGEGDLSLAAEAPPALPLTHPDTERQEEDTQHNAYERPFRNTIAVSNWATNFARGCKNALSDIRQAKIQAGHVRISWTCRCGDRLRIEVAESQQLAAIAFAQHAAGPNASTVTAQSPRSSDLTLVNSQHSSTTDTTASSAAASGSTGSQSSPPQSPNTVPSDDDTAAQPDPFVPTGTKKYMLLCVNTTLHARRQRKLTNVDVTDVDCGEELFRRLRAGYDGLRNSRNPFLVPKTMHFVKLQLLHLQKSGECVGNYTINSIPSRKEVLNQEYAFTPCPPRLGDLPMPPDIFMHAFLNPADHLGPVAIEMLPKKLWCKLGWDRRVHDHFNIPYGWGFYISEGANWALLSWCAAVALLAVTGLTVTWSVVLRDVQGGTGLGQYCLAVLAVSVSVYLLKHSVQQDG
ncbi:hypothetical protein B0H66DRAFT_555718 [Apodospora peruviana]|uniref:Uncharacterized protein n=1 Tax=Apodospora peruviana TaxID=516989 RepID=A0AAE0IDE2_9PEZI|nr:hypothetical protein B0H66DRAFT_555718 [Apodospora peruviana]